MAHTLIPKPKRVIPSPPRHRPVEDRRVELAPLLGETLLVSGRVSAHGHRPVRHYLCLEDVEYCSLEQERLPLLQRETQAIDHAWQETTDLDLVPSVGRVVSNVATVIYYIKKDGSTSYGFRLRKSRNNLLYCAETCSELLDEINSDECISPTGVIQLRFNRFQQELKAGVCNDGVLLTYGGRGQKNCLYSFGKWYKTLMRCAKKGRFDLIERMLEDICQKRVDAMEIYEENSR